MPKIIMKDAEGKEREFEVGMDEAFKVVTSSAWPAAMLRTYGEHQDQSIKGSRAYHTHARNMNLAAFQCVQNAIENANNAAKQHLERVNAHNMNVAANMDQSSDTMLGLLVAALKENGEATITISRPKKKA